MEDLACHREKDDVVMPCRLRIQVRDEIECYLMDNFRKQYEEIDFQLKSLDIRFPSPVH